MLPMKITLSTYEAQNRPRIDSFFCVSLTIATLLWVVSLRAANIFDDDWTPPASKKTDQHPTQTLPTTPAEPVEKHSADLFKPGIPSTVKSSAAILKHPIPAKDAQARSRTLFKEIFAKELADRSASGRRVLAAMLLKEASKIKEATADQFILLVGATEAGREAADLTLSFTAADALANTYEIDAFTLKQDIALKISLRSDTEAGGVDNCRAALELVDSLVEGEEYLTAIRLLQAMRPAAAADLIINQHVQSRLKDVEAIRVASERLLPQWEKLKNSPNDPVANQAVGRFYCLMKDDWVRGVQALAKSDHAAMKLAAEIDLANPKDNDSKIDVGNAWWDVAEKESGLAQLNFRQRAVQWYHAALQGGTVAGLNRILIEKRIALVPAKFDRNSPLSHAPLVRNVLLFRNLADDDLQLFKGLSGGKIKTFSGNEILAMMKRPNIYSNVGIVVFGVNRLRSIAPIDLTDEALKPLQRFVQDGGDVIIFEQFGAENMSFIDGLFGFKTIGAGNGVEAMHPVLKSLATDAGYTESILKVLHFYNSYVDLPEHSVVLIRNTEGQNTSVIVPFGRGRIILIGMNFEPSARKLQEAILETIYHYKATRH